MGGIVRQTPEGAQLSIIRSDEAWYARANNIRTPELNVSGDFPDGSCNWEFIVKEYDLRGSTVRVMMFSDAFDAFGHIPWFFEYLREAQPTTVVEVQEFLIEHGAQDKTKRESPYGSKQADMLNTWEAYKILVQKGFVIRGPIEED